jgi:hypothetical protein
MVERYFWLLKGVACATRCARVLPMHRPHVPIPFDFFGYLYLVKYHITPKLT